MKNLFSAIKSNVSKRRNNENHTSRRATRKAIAELNSLSDAQLRDIGIDRGSIAHSVKYGKDAA